MKSMIMEIRGEINIDKAKLNDLNEQIDTLTTKYLNEKLGYKEFKRQLHKIVKSKHEVREALKAHIAYLEEVEQELGREVNEGEEKIEAMAGNA